MAPAVPLEVDPTEAVDLLRDGAALVDVREGWEFDGCRIPGAIHIPLGELPARISEIPTDRPVVVNCHHGGRSMRAVQWLRSQGIGQATNLKGGIDRWSIEIDGSIPRY